MATARLVVCLSPPPPSPSSFLTEPYSTFPRTSQKLFHFSPLHRHCSTESKWNQPGVWRLWSLENAPNYLKRRRAAMLRAKKIWWVDPFDRGEDPDMENGDLFAEGPQEAEGPMPPLDPDSPYGFRIFPERHLPEIASLGLLLRGDVRRCCCLVAGGVYENLLFFPVIQMLKDRYPGVKIDVVATERGKQTYEINKNVRRAWVYDLDADFVVPVEHMDFVGTLKGYYYDRIVSTKLAGIGHSGTMWLTGARDKISYTYPNVNAAGAGMFLSEPIKAPRLNLAEGGYNMYAELVDEFSKPNRYVPATKVRPLEVSISRRLKEVVQKKYLEQGANKENFLVFHGIKSDSVASMQSRGDPDSLLSLELWAELARSTSLSVVFIIPKEMDRLLVQTIVGKDAKTVFITTPGQLAAIINDAKGVVTTNTAAVQLACALRKPSVALFSSAEKASLFVPDAMEKKCTLVASKTGRLADIDIRAAIAAISFITEKVMIRV